MTKETSQPKAVNIIRPTSGNNNNLYNSLSHSSSGSTTSTNSRRTGSLLSATSTNSARKPRVAGTSIVKSSMEKPILNLYHPPSRKPSYDNNTVNNNSKRPTIELYKPPSQQQKMTKSYTAPSLTLPNESKIHSTNNNIHYNRPISPSYIRPQQSQQQQQQQQPQQYHRSVLGVINTPAAAASSATTVIHTSPSDIVNKSTSSPLITDNQQKSEESNPTNSKHLDQDREALGDDLDIEDEKAEDDEIPEIEDDEEYDDDDDEEEDEGEEDEEEEEEPVINEARVNRKIADLELSINSLLTVNAMLEATVRKQALQLSQIKKQKSSGDGGAAHIELLLDPHQEEVTDQTDQEDDEDDWENDALFQKLRKVTEHMIEQGQKSIDFEYKILGRVLSNYTAIDEDAEDEEDDDEGEEDAGDQIETTSEEGATDNDTVAEKINSNTDKTPSQQIRNNTYESNSNTSKKATTSIPRNVNKFTRRKATPKSHNIHIST